MKKKEMLKNELIALGLISKDPIHGYAINKAMKNMEFERWGAVSPASIYNVLSRLAHEGKVKMIIEKVGNTPKRNTYSITQKGKDRLKELVKQAIRSVDCQGSSTLFLGLGFASVLSTSEQIHLLEKRSTGLDKEMDCLHNAMVRLKSENATLALINLKNRIKHLKVERESAKTLILSLSN